MARKDLLKGLMGDDTPADGKTEPSKAPSPRYTKGAIGAVSQSIADLKSRSVIEVDPSLIEAGGLDDRLEHDQADHDRLMDSIREYGQQVPVLVRHHPEKEDKFQIVYGRRRVLALRDLGRPVKAMVRDLDDKALVIAQGQENSARRDLSFAERVNFTRQMVEAGYDRKIIADALSTDKTLISRMISVSEAVPPALFQMIGAAPGIGRDRWLGFARLWTEARFTPEDAEAMLGTVQKTGPDARFNHLWDWLVKRSKAPAKSDEVVQTSTLFSSTGSKLGIVRKDTKGLTLTFDSKATKGFDLWLSENLPEIHHDWLKTRGE